jgi:pimeloyl-ACP methyl ester carboxylesterase
MQLNFGQDDHDNVKDLLDDPCVSSAIFYPRKLTAQIESEFVKPVTFELDDHTTIGGILYLHQNHINKPTILFFHGNGEIAYDYQYFVNDYLDCGINLFVVDYRGYGLSKGRPTYTSLFEDPKRIVDELLIYLLNHYSGKCAEQIFVMGRSLGSICASVLGALNFPTLKGIIFESGFGDNLLLMKELFMIDHPLLTEKNMKHYSNDTYIAKIKKPCLVIHGTNDSIVPYSQGQYLYSKIPDNVEKRFVSIHGATHNDINMFHDEYYLPIKEFIKKNSS